MKLFIRTLECAEMQYNYGWNILFKTIPHFIHIRLQLIIPSLINCNADDILGGLPTIFFGDFAQLPPVGDSPMYSDKPSGYCTALHAEGHCVFGSFKQSVTLNTIFRQAGQDPAQVIFREALLRL